MHGGGGLCVRSKGRCPCVYVCLCVCARVGTQKMMRTHVSACMQRNDVHVCLCVFMCVQKDDAHVCTCTCTQACSNSIHSSRAMPPGFESNPTQGSYTISQASSAAPSCQGPQSREAHGWRLKWPWAAGCGVGAAAGDQAGPVEGGHGGAGSAGSACAAGSGSTAPRA